jgi:hypothetical protein
MGPKRIILSAFALEVPLRYLSFCTPDKKSPANTPFDADTKTPPYSGAF